MAVELIDALGLAAGDLVALVGGGGKTSLLLAIGERWSGRALMTTTTRLAREEVARAAASVALTQLGSGTEQPGIAGERNWPRLVIGGLEGEKALGVSPELPRQWLDDDLADLVVVEADGARGRPVKAPAAHEPALPTGTSFLIIVAGLDALEQPLERVAHRLQRVTSLTGLIPGDKLTPVTLAALLAHPDGGLKGATSDMRVIVCLNKADSAQRQRGGRETAVILRTNPRIDGVLVTSFRSSPIVKDTF